jgi:hypothetical protein
MVDLGEGRPRSFDVASCVVVGRQPIEAARAMHRFGEFSFCSPGPANSSCRLDFALNTYLRRNLTYRIGLLRRAANKTKLSRKISKHVCRHVQSRLSSRNSPPTARWA